MVRLRGKSCPSTSRWSVPGGEGAKRVATPVPGPRAATGGRVTSSAGECGVKDQVSRTRPAHTGSGSTRGPDGPLPPPDRRSGGRGGRRQTKGQRMDTASRGRKHQG